MLRFSLELYLSALRLNLQNAGFDRKLAVLNLAQCVELAIKAALVEENESIFEKEAKTINTHKAGPSHQKLDHFDRIAKVPSENHGDTCHA